MQREWNKEMDDMVDRFKAMSTTQANSYIETDLKNWIIKVCAMGSEGAIEHK